MFEGLRVQSGVFSDSIFTLPFIPFTLVKCHSRTHDPHYYVCLHREGLTRAAARLEVCGGEITGNLCKVQRQTK